eukprot:1348308-Ditylum_brightwellii.AAC.1
MVCAGGQLCCQARQDLVGDWRLGGTQGTSQEEREEQAGEDHLHWSMADSSARHHQQHGAVMRGVPQQSVPLAWVGATQPATKV